VFGAAGDVDGGFARQAGQEAPDGRASVSGVMNVRVGEHGVATAANGPPGIRLGLREEVDHVTAGRSDPLQRPLYGRRIEGVTHHRVGGPQGPPGCRIVAEDHDLAAVHLDPRTGGGHARVDPQVPGKARIELAVGDLTERTRGAQRGRRPAVGHGLVRVGRYEDTRWLLRNHGAGEQRAFHQHELNLPGRDSCISAELPQGGRHGLGVAPPAELLGCDPRRTTGGSHKRTARIAFVVVGGSEHDGVRREDTLGAARHDGDNGHRDRRLPGGGGHPAREVVDASVALGLADHGESP
jgi:hypothetical protein